MLFPRLLSIHSLALKYLPGLGGLLTGNAAHGGLSASAGTPFGNLIAHEFKFLIIENIFLGQRAAAGLGGTVDEAGLQCI